MELQDRVQTGVLLSEYGGLLTEKQREMLGMYADADMSLAEIAEEYGVTRQAVRDSIKHAVETLANAELQVGKIELKRRLGAELDKLCAGGADMAEKLSALYKILEG